MKIQRTGFSLVELMITLLIIGVLTSILLPNYSKIQIKAKERAVKGVAHTLQLAVESYYFDTGQYPDGNDVDALGLSEIFQESGELSQLPINPFTGSAVESDDPSGAIAYSFDDGSGQYEISAYGYLNESVILLLSN